MIVMGIDIGVLTPEKIAESKRFGVIYDVFDYIFWVRKHFPGCDERDARALYGRLRNALYYTDREIRIDDLEMKEEDIIRLKDMFVEVYNEFPQIHYWWKELLKGGKLFPENRPEHKLFK